MEPSGETTPNDSSQQGPIMGPQPDKMRKNNTAKYFGRSKFSAAQNSPAPNMAAQTTPAQTAPIISSNPNTPQFFNEAMAANANIPSTTDQKQARKSSNKIIYIGIGIIAVILVAIIGILVARNMSGGETYSSDLSGYTKKNMAYIYGEYEGDYKDFAKVGEVNYENYNLVSKIEKSSKEESSTYYAELNENFDKISESVSDSKISDARKKTVEKIVSIDKNSLLAYYHIAKVLNSNEIKNYSLDATKKALEDIENEKGKFDEAGQSGKNVYGLIKTYLENMKKKSEIYNERGCIEYGQANYECIGKIKASDLVGVSNTEAVEKDLIKRMTENRNILFRDSVTMYLIANGGVDE